MAYGNHHASETIEYEGETYYAVSTIAREHGISAQNILDWMHKRTHYEKKKLHCEKLNQKCNYVSEEAFDWIITACDEYHEKTKAELMRPRPVIEPRYVKKPDRTKQDLLADIMRMEDEEAQKHALAILASIPTVAES